MANFYSIITNRGKELEAEALASGTKITLVKFVVGDGNGQATQPKPTQTKLVNEKYRGDIADLSVSPEQSTQMMAKIVLPTEVGGFTVREIGILTDAGELYAVANCAAIEKPVGGVSVNMQFRLAVSDMANITLNVATGDGLFLRIDQDLSEIRGRGAQAQKAARESLAVMDASTNQKGLVQLNSATNSTSETQAATPAAVKAVKDSAVQKDGNLFDIADKSKARKNLELGTAAIKDAVTSMTDVTESRVPVVGWMGLGGSARASAAGDVHVGRMFYEPFQSGTLYPASVAVTQSAGPSPTEWGQIAISYGDDLRIFAGHGVYNKPPEITEFYHDKRKPTASDTGAYPITGGALNGDLVTKDGYDITSGQDIWGSRDIYAKRNLIVTHSAEVGQNLTVEGNIITKGSISAGGLIQSGPHFDIVSQQDILASRHIYEHDQRVFSPNNPPPDKAIGVEQGWVDVTGDRMGGVTYTNSTPKPIMVTISIGSASGGDNIGNGFGFFVDNVSISSIGATNQHWATTLTCIIPSGSIYYISLDKAKIQRWSELR